MIHMIIFGESGNTGESQNTSGSSIYIGSTIRGFILRNWLGISSAWAPFAFRVPVPLRFGIGKGQRAKAKAKAKKKLWVQGLCSASDLFSRKPLSLERLSKKKDRYGNQCGLTL